MRYEVFKKVEKEGKFITIKIGILDLFGDKMEFEIYDSEIEKALREIKRKGQVPGPVGCKVVGEERILIAGFYKIGSKFFLENLTSLLGIDLVEVE